MLLITCRTGQKCITAKPNRLSTHATIAVSSGLLLSELAGSCQHCQCQMPDMLTVFRLFLKLCDQVACRSSYSATANFSQTRAPPAAPRHQHHQLHPDTSTTSLTAPRTQPLRWSHEHVTSPTHSPKENCSFDAFEKLRPHDESSKIDAVLRA